MELKPTTTGDGNNKLTDFPVHSKNPFLVDLIIPKGQKTVIVPTTNEWELINHDTGEVKSTFIGVRQRIDKDAFAKVYLSQIRALFGLSNAGIRLFGYTLNALRIGEDTVRFNVSEALEFTGYASRKAVYRGLAELLENKILARSEKKDLYYLNPSLCFNGDRLVVVNEYIKEAENANIKALKKAK